MCQEYNGWGNRETWAVKLWIDNDGYAGGCESVMDKARELMRDSANDADYIQASSRLADWLEQMITSDYDESAASAIGLWSDLLNGALGKVDWREIAVAYIGDVQFLGSDGGASVN
jgi:hypothetical protein